MTFRFRKRGKIAPGLGIHLSKKWPSLSIGGHGAALNVSRRGSRMFGIPGSDLSWQFGGPRYLHKAIQAQADVKAVHAQGTAKAVEAQEYIVAITNRLETLAKRLTRSAPESSYWKKAAIEQAQLLDEMLDAAKASENDQLVSAVRRCHESWANYDPHIRAALNSGMTVTECLAMKLAGEEPDQNVPADLLNHPVTTTDKANRQAADDSSTNRKQLILGRNRSGWFIDEMVFWPAFGRRLARNLILAAIGCGLIAGVYTIAARKPIMRPRVIVSATPTPEASAAMLALATQAEPPGAETPAATPAPTAAASSESSSNPNRTGTPRKSGPR